MPALLTEVTELATGLGMTGCPTLDEALADRPAALRNVADDTWQGLLAARETGEHQAAFATAWDNGRAFFEAPDGLRGRVPLCIEWKGPHRQPGYDNLPVDLRVDHVFLVSCKYQSRILSNSSPANLFERHLASRGTDTSGNSWYGTVAPQSYREFYAQLRDHLGSGRLPAEPAALDGNHLQFIRESCGRAWPEALREPWARLSFDIATESARRWNSHLDSDARREEMLWRLLRLGPTPYFVLGSSTRGPVRIRLATPWDWRQNFVLREFRVAPVAGGQPVVEWSALVDETATGRRRRVQGHVEIRWAHGRFSTVEAKIYLDTPYHAVPGYFPLDPDAEPSAAYEPDVLFDDERQQLLFDEYGVVVERDQPTIEQRTLWSEP